MRSRCASPHRSCPRFTRLMEKTGRASHLAGRVRLETGCSAVEDRELCCSAMDRFGDTCVAAVTKFTNDKVCMNSQWVVRYNSFTTQIPGIEDAVFAYQDVAACPAQFDTPITSKGGTASARMRTRLPHGVGCHTIKDRAQCCASTDGRTEAIHVDQPCVAAQIQFINGFLCETARYVKDLDATSSASCAEFHLPVLADTYRRGRDGCSRGAENFSCPAISYSHDAGDRVHDDRLPRK